MRNNKTSHRPANSITRRRSLQIIGSAFLVSSAALSASQANEVQTSSENLKEINWQGIVLGANASITLYSDDEARAKQTIEKMLLEVKRLESYFSLYQNNSLINSLNKNGELTSPPAEFKDLITKAKNYARLTNGAFDPTIQPLFMAYKTVSKQTPIPSFINNETIKKAHRLIGWQNIAISNHKISFEKKNMAITLNGIAQGYITDKAVMILKANGFENTLINFGEYHGIGSKPFQNNWKIQLGETKQKNKTRKTWSVKNNAIAASDKHGYTFNSENQLHHMLDPKTGANQKAWREIYVLAKNATRADAASTALFASPPEQIENIFNKLKLEKALLIKESGEEINL